MMQQEREAQQERALAIISETRVKAREYLALGFPHLAKAMRENIRAAEKWALAVVRNGVRKP